MSKKYVYFIVIILLLVAVRLSLPFIGKYYINRSLKNNLESYEGSIERLSISLLVGSYTLHQLTLSKKQSGNQPFVKFDKIIIQIAWKELLDAKVEVVASGIEGKVVFVDSDETKQVQFGTESEKKEGWAKTFQSVIPLKIKKISLRNVEFSFENRDMIGFEHNRLEVAKFEAIDLTDPEIHKYKLSPIILDAKLNGHADLNLTGGINLKTDSPSFDINLRLASLDLTTLNKLLKHYVPLDITTGQLSVYSEFTGTLQKASGYSRIFFDNLDIIKPDQEYKSSKHLLIEWLSGLANWLLSLSKVGDVATEVPFSFDKGTFKIDSSESFWNLLENSVDEIPKDFKDK